MESANNLESDILQNIFIKNKEIVFRKIAGETILVPISGQLADLQRIFSLNPLAEYIWHQLDGKRNLQEIINSIVSNYEVQQGQVVTDIREFISELLKENLITGVH